jgi:hypothetical protein
MVELWLSALYSLTRHGKDRTQHHHHLRRHGRRDRAGWCPWEAAQLERPPPLGPWPPYDVVDEMDEALQTSDKETQLGIAHELIENSPYPPIAVSYRLNNTENWGVTGIISLTDDPPVPPVGRLRWSGVVFFRPGLKQFLCRCCFITSSALVSLDHLILGLMQTWEGIKQYLLAVVVVKLDIIYI